MLGAQGQRVALRQVPPVKATLQMALRRRFALDYDGRARLRVHTQPGAGFRVDLWIPQAT